MTIELNHTDCNQEIPRDDIDLKGPWRSDSRTTVLIDCRDHNELSVLATIQSILASTTQNLDVICLAPAKDIELRVINWTLSDSRVRCEDRLPEELPSQGAILVISAGIIFTPFSLEALWESLRLPNVSLIRSVVVGVNGTLEFWDASWLSRAGRRSEAEANARARGFERWISAEGLGIHALGLPEPRLFFRRGAADRHIIDVVAYDSKSLEYVESREKEIRKLRQQNALLRRTLEGQKVRRPLVGRMTKLVLTIRNRGR